MSSFHRQNMYSNSPQEDPMDMSGFLGEVPRSEFDAGAQEPPKVVPRARATSSNASGTSGTIGYTTPMTMAEPEEPKLYHAISPFWADDDGIAPQAAAISKTIGVTGMVLSGTYALAKRNEGGSPAAKAAFFGSSAMYVHPTLGLNHGLLKVIPGKDHWVAKYPRYGGIGVIHVLGAYGFYKLIRGQFYV